MMREIITERLLLRKFSQDDFAAVHSYASVLENIIYMVFEPNTPEQTTAFIKRAIATAAEEPCRDFQFAVVLKNSGGLIGGCQISISGDCGEVGWLLHRDFWRQGFGTEVGAALLAFGFDELNLRRIVARCDAENVGSYGVMEKIGMRREGLLIEKRPPNKLSERKFSDELIYAKLKDEHDVEKEIAYYNAQPCVFEEFIDVPELVCGEIRLVCIGKKPAISEKKYVPAYAFAVCKGSEKIGSVDLRIGYCGNLYYGGQIGYSIDEKHRGNGYAGIACRLLLPVARAHGMKTLLITNDVSNAASKRVCEKLGAKLVRVARVPEWNELYKTGQRYMNVFEWKID